MSEPTRIFVFLLIVSLSSIATATPSQWTNSATHPSMSRDRGVETIYALLDPLNVPTCARSELASKLYSGRTRPLMIGNDVIFSPEDEYSTEMAMTFRKDGVDYVSEVYPYVYAPFVGEVASVTCDEQTIHVGYMPKCQNLARLNYVGPYRGSSLNPGHPKGHGGKGGGCKKNKDCGGDNTPVPSPSSLLLLLIGLLAMAFYAKRVNKRIKRRR